MEQTYLNCGMACEDVLLLSGKSKGELLFVYVKCFPQVIHLSHF